MKLKKKADNQLFEDFNGVGIWLVENFFTKKICLELLNQAHSVGFQKAHMHEQGRHNQESFIKDTNLETIIINNLNGISLLQNTTKYIIRGVSLPLEFYQYQKGDYIKGHSDAYRDIGNGLISSLTFIVYLNDNYSGGETLFPTLGYKIIPKSGRALIFRQELFHEASIVTQNVKYILRCDIVIDEI